MRCPQDTEFWQRYIEQGDAEATRHLQSCAACRAEAARAARVTGTLASLPSLDAPQSITARFQALVLATAGRRLSCADALSALEAWREGELEATYALLMDDHLLDCAACAAVLAQAEQLSLTLHALPMLQPPAVIAERLAAARLPWWQRMLQPVPSFSWGRFAPAAASFCAAAMLLLACILRAPQAPQVATVPFRHHARSFAQLHAGQSGTSSRLAARSLREAQRQEEELASGSDHAGGATTLGNGDLTASLSTDSASRAGASPRITPPRDWNNGGLVPDMDAPNVESAKGTTVAALPSTEPAEYSSYDTIEHDAKSYNMAIKESTTFETADLAAAPVRPTTPPEDLTPKPTHTVELPKTDNSNADINRMIKPPHVPYVPAPVKCVSGEAHANSNVTVVRSGW